MEQLDPAHGNHNAPLFLAGEGGYPLREMGNIRQLMVVYSNTECSNSLGSTFDVAVWDSLKAGGLYKRLGGWQVPLCHWLSRIFQ